MGFITLDIDALLVDYNNGLSLRKLAEKYGTSRITIKKKLEDCGISYSSDRNIIDTKVNVVEKLWENRGYNWDNRDNLFDLYESQRLSTSEIAKIYGVDAETVRVRLHKHGIQTRTVSESSSLAASKNFCKRSEISKSLWKNQEFRNQIKSKLTGKKIKMPENHSENVSAAMRKLHNNIEYLQNKSDLQKKLWEDPTQPMLDHLRDLHQQAANFVSSLEIIVGEILDDFGIPYKKVWLGSYEFDIMIDKEHTLSGKHLLIEVNGLYWHYNDKNDRDSKKLRYWKDNLECDYDFIYLWEHEYNSPCSVSDKLLNLLKVDQVKYDCKSLVLKLVNNDVAKSFYNKYHYLGDNHAGQHIAAMLGDRIVACATFSGVTRKESAKKQGCEVGQIKELSRFCIHPIYNKFNLASWFMSRIIKLYQSNNPGVKKLISFADSTLGHNGTIYKASNWTYDGETKNSYHYACGPCRWHKRTIWGWAKKLKVKESEFVKMFDLVRVDTNKKFRFIYNIQR